MDDVRVCFPRILGTALGSALLILDLQAPNIHSGANTRPDPRHAHEEHDRAQLEGRGERVRDGEVLVNSYVHERVYRRDEAERVHPAIELTHGSITKNPAVADHSYDRERHQQDAHQ